MFDFLRRNKKKVAASNPNLRTVEDEIYAAATGGFLKITEIDDPVFSEKMMGDGYGIEPSVGEVYAPVAGIIMSVFPTKHAFYIKTDSGLEVLVHMGLDTVELEGAPFTNQVAEGGRVKQGDLLSTIDLAALAKSGKGSTIVVAITNMEKVNDLQFTASGQVIQSEAIGSVTTVVDN